MSNIGSEGFAYAVVCAKEYNQAGDAYQVVPSQRWTADCPVDAFSIYRGLRAINPSPYMYFLDFEDFEIAGASPESLVKVEGRRVELKPIAGTRPRTGSDLELSADLLADEKERAEHRSEEHTSELQSLTNLVCRLLLEKKKKKENTKPNTQKKKEITHKK